MRVANIVHGKNKPENNNKKEKLTLPTGLIAAVLLLVLTAAGCSAEINTQGGGGMELPDAPQPVGQRATLTPAPTAAPAEPPFNAVPLPPAESVHLQLAYFYKPPVNADAAQLSDRFETFILTKNDEQLRDDLNRRGVERPVLQYLVAHEFQNPGSCSEQPLRNQVTDQPGDFCRIMEEHPDWVLRYADGEPVYDDDYYMIDPASPGWRDFFIQRASESQAIIGWQGVFLDNIEASLAKRLRKSGGELPASYPDDASYQAAIEEYLRQLYQGYFQPQGRPLYANIIETADSGVWLRYLQFLDGAMIENFAVDWTDGHLDESQYNLQLELARLTQALGKEIILVSQGTQSDTRRQTFALASYWLVNDGRASFRYTNDAHYDEVWLYDNYDLQPGAPLGPRYREGSLWVRDFTNGQVRVDPLNNTAEIRITNP